MGGDRWPLPGRAELERRSNVLAGGTPGDALEESVKLALVVEADACGNLRLRNTTDEERPREGDASMGHVGVRWQTNLIAEGTTETKLVESCVLGQIVECDRLGEASVEERARTLHRDRPPAARARGLSMLRREFAQGA